MNEEKIVLKSYVKIKLNGECGQVIKISNESVEENKEYNVRLFKSLRTLWFKEFELEKLDSMPYSSRV